MTGFERRRVGFQCIAIQVWKLMNILLARWPFVHDVYLREYIYVTIQCIADEH